MANDGPLYPNQPLIEVATEVRFKGDLAVEHIRAEYQKRIEVKYPVLKAPGAVHGVAPSLQPYRFETDSGDKGVQLAINSISCFARDYPGKDVFLENAKFANTTFLEFIGSINVTRIGWRYINSIPFTRENGFLPLSRFFKDSAIFGSALSVNLSNVCYQATLEMHGSMLNIRLESSTGSDQEDEEVIILDIDSYETFESPRKMKGEDVSVCIRSKHDAARDIFEDLITDGYREFLKGGDDE